MGKAWTESEHVSNAVAWLASDQSYYVSGGQIPVTVAPRFSDRRPWQGVSSREA